MAGWNGFSSIATINHNNKPPQHNQEQQSNQVYHDIIAVITGRITSLCVSGSWPQLYIYHTKQYTNMLQKSLCVATIPSILAYQSLLHSEILLKLVAMMPVS
jgi:hypothetical protein